MPVGTQATVKGLLQRDLAGDLDAKIILANTYHLFLRPGHELIRELGGLHRFMSWPRAILTDSGGFQVFSLSGLRKITEEGVLFHSHLNGDAHMFTPESTVDVQLALGSDIMMVLDECLEYPVSHEAARRVHATARCAGRSAALPALSAAAKRPDRTAALFPIVQGSMFADLRRALRATSCSNSTRDGYAIGGLSVGEPRALSLEMAEVTAPLLPARPAALRHGRRHAGGAAGIRRARRRHDGLRAAVAQCPQRIPVYVAKAEWSSNRRRYKERSAARGSRTAAAITCRNFLARLSAAPVSGRARSCSRRSRRCTICNGYLDIMREIRQAILLGRFPEYLDSVRKLAR